MKKQPLENILEKRCSFSLADIDSQIFIDFLVLEKRKTERCRVDSCRSSIFEKDQVCVVSTSTVKNALKGVLVTKENLRSNFSTISDLIRDEKFVDFYQIRKYFEQLVNYEMYLYSYLMQQFHNYVMWLFILLYDIVSKVM